MAPNHELEHSVATVESRLMALGEALHLHRAEAVESEAANLADIIAEMRASTSSEREGRAIDHDSSGSMERKKREGYF